MNLSEQIRQNFKEADERLEALWRQDIIDQFGNFIKEKYNIDLDKIEQVTNEDVNEFFSDKFLDAEYEEDIDDLNAQEEFIRKEYHVPNSDYEDESIFEPTEEDLAEMKYWYNDNPADLYESQELNDFKIKITPDKRNALWLLFIVEKISTNEKLISGAGKVLQEESELFGIPDYGQIIKLSYDGIDECNYERGWGDLLPKNKELFNYVCSSLISFRNNHPYEITESSNTHFKKLNEHNDSWLTNTDPTNHGVKPFVDFFKEQYPDKQIDKLWLEGIEGGWEPCVAFIESNGTVYRIYLDELNNGIYMSHPSGIKIVSNNFKNDYDYIND